jgi:tRNA pseudouridine38-40 synthase
VRTIKLLLEYDGTRYCGWQRQSPGHCGKPSIQETVERALKVILRERAGVLASGRTDAGVHARAQVSHFSTRSSLPLNTLLRSLNGLLPQDICAHQACEVASSFHSRFDASEKTYRYTILNREFPSPLYRHTVHHVSCPLDLARMKRAAQTLKGTHDFKGFKASAKKEISTTRTVTHIKLAKEGDFIYIDIAANGFLHTMVRTIAGTLIEVGKGRFPSSRIRAIFSSGDRRLAGPTAPARALCLVKVSYGATSTQTRKRRFPVCVHTD